MPGGRPTEQPTAFLLLFLAGAALSGPAGIVLHELAHGAAAYAFGFPGVQLHSTSISYDGSTRLWALLSAGDRAAAAALFPLWQVGVVALAGPLVTLGLTLGSAVLLRRRSPSRPLPQIWRACLAGWALMASVRGLTSVYYVLVVRPQYPDARPNFDEINAARALDAPVDWLVWPTLLVILLSWALAVPTLRPFWPMLPAALMGPVLGVLLWAVVGPWLLG